MHVHKIAEILEIHFLVNITNFSSTARMKHDKMTIFYCEISFTSIYLVRLMGGRVSKKDHEMGRKECLKELVCL